MSQSDTKTPEAKTGNQTDVLSQWQLIRLRFRKHKLAVISLYVVLALYAVAIFAEIFAPYTQSWRDTDYLFAPPQVPQFSFEHGLHVNGMERAVDPVTLRSVYRTDPETIVPLRFFVPGEPYKFWGLIPMDRHLFGVYLDGYQPSPDFTGQPVAYLLGSDRYGHDILSRLIYGSRISLSIGVVAIAITFILGIIIGGISGYMSGWVDNMIQRFMEIVNGFPNLPLWIALGAVMPRSWSPIQIYFAILVLLSVLNWPGLARVVRGKILSLREEDYAVAARLLGASHARILFRHLMPGFTSHIIVGLTLSVPGMILGETAMSFLGIGLRPPIVSWGVMLQETINLEVVGFSPWLLMPVILIIVTVLAFNFLGDGLRDAADPYS